MNRRRLRMLLAIFATLTTPAVASAETTTQTPGAWRRLGAFGAALVPGVALHGAGHFALGARTTASRLFALGTTGTVLAVGAGLTYEYSSASRYVSGVSIAAGLSGAAMMALSWIADIQGSLAPSGLQGAPLRQMPWLEVSTGYLAVVDPACGSRHAVTFAGDLRWRSLRLSPSFSAAFVREDWQARLAVASRFIGPRPSTSDPVADGSFLDVEAAAGWRGDGESRFERVTGELSLRGRLDLARLGPSLRGTFAEIGVGLALLATTRDAGNAAAVDTSSALLLHAGYGLYFGRPDALHGEVMAYYDHRHDGYAGGMFWTGSLSGTPGRVGAVGAVHFGPRWGLAGEVQVGSAVVLQLNVLIRAGEVR